MVLSPRGLETSPKQMRLHLDLPPGHWKWWLPQVGRDRHEGPCGRKEGGPRRGFARQGPFRAVAQRGGRKGWGPCQAVPWKGWRKPTPSAPPSEKQPGKDPAE